MRITSQLHNAAASFAFPAAAIILTAVTAGCGKSGKATAEDLQAARNRARTQAVELASKTDTLLIENILIDVRERETFLRNHGHEDVADTYVETFLEVLDSVSPAIAAELH